MLTLGVTSVSGRDVTVAGQLQRKKPSQRRCTSANRNRTNYESITHLNSCLAVPSTITEGRIWKLDNAAAGVDGISGKITRDELSAWEDYL